MAPSPLSRTLSKSRSRRGFTLVELMAVVVIVGILAVVAVAGYRKLVVSSHTSEATHMIQAIRVAQESYRAETGSYADISAGLAANQSSQHSSLYPCQPAIHQDPGAFKTDWNVADCGAACNTTGGVTFSWKSIPLHVDGPVMYGYTTKAGLAGVAPTFAVTINGAQFGWPADTAVTQDWFVVSAVGDPDGNGTFSTVLGSSFTNDISIDNDGE